MHQLSYSTLHTTPIVEIYSYNDVLMGAIASQITSLTIVLLTRLFRRRSKKTSKLRVTGLCAGNSPGTGEFPTQMASNVENVSIWWRHHVCYTIYVHSFERHNVLHRSSGIGDLGGFRWELAATLSVAWLLVFLCLVKGIKTSGKVIGYTFGGKLLGHVILSAALHAHAGMGFFWHLLITVTS